MDFALINGHWNINGKEKKKGEKKVVKVKH